MDRIDLHVEVTPVEFTELSSTTKAESSEHIRQRVIKAREIQTERFKDKEGMYTNAQMEPKLVLEVCQINEAAKNLLGRAMQKLQLSARAYDRILKVARTIADLSASKEINTEHIAEAIQYRSLDRENWA